MILFLITIFKPVESRGIYHTVLPDSIFFFLFFFWSHRHTRSHFQSPRVFFFTRLKFYLTRGWVFSILLGTFQFLFLFLFLFFSVVAADLGFDRGLLAGRNVWVSDICTQSFLGRNISSRVQGCFGERNEIYLLQGATLLELLVNAFTN